MKWLGFALVGVGLFFLTRKTSTSSSNVISENAVASFYGPGFNGKPTANREIFDENALTAAHKTLPFDSFVLVTNLENGRSVRVRINDRGPFVEGRDIDLSVAAAKAIGLDKQGLAHVRLEFVF